MTSNWQGCFLTIDNGIAHGWARMPAHADVQVELCYRGSVLALSDTRYYSAALAEAGIGDGHHAFAIAIPQSLSKQAYGDLKVRIRGTPFELPRHYVLDDTPHLLGKTSLQGHLDGIDGLMVRGWAWNAAKPEEPVMLDLLLDGALAARVECNEYRSDLMLLGMGNGCHGFQAALPLHVMDGKMRTLSLRFSNSEETLHGCPCPVQVKAVLGEHALQHASKAAGLAQEQLQQMLGSVRALCPPPAPAIAFNEEARRYRDWIAKHDTLTETDRHAISQHIMQMRKPPLISVLMPTYNTPEKYLREAIESVLNQLYPHFELCIADDASPKPHMRDVLEEYAAKDSRIKLVFRPENGHISEATNSALAIATGEYAGLFDHDDLLAPHALYMMAEAILRTRAELLYCDEDKVDENGIRFEPHFKPAWNPLYLHACNYVTHFTVVKRERLLIAGGLHTRYNGSQDHELVLRLARQIAPERVCHVPFILYHWRAFADSTALKVDAKSYAVQARLKAVTEHAKLRDKKAEVRLMPWGGCDVKWSIRGTPKVSIIIPTRDNAKMLALCVASIREKTDYANYEILIIDNGSIEQETVQLFTELKRHTNIRVIPYDAPFNYSAINNFALKHAKGSMLCLMNNDMEVVSSDWLSRMIALLQHKGAGAVGARLLYPDGRIQHGGVIVGMGGVAGHYHRETPAGSLGYVLRAVSDQHLSAVTAACMLTYKSCFKEVGGLDETHLPVAFNDVDYCLKLRAKGYHIIYSAHSVLLHHESATRGKEDTPAKKFRAHSEITVMKQRWKHVLGNDPYFSPNLSLERDDLHAIAEAPRVWKPWHKSSYAPAPQFTVREEA